MTTIEDPTHRPDRRVVIAPARAVAPARRGSSKGTGERASASVANETISPTTDIRRVLIVFAVGMCLAALFSAKTLVHAGKGMDYGLERTVTLGIAEPLLAITDTLRLTLPWDAAESALGRSTDVESAPLLSNGSVQRKKPAALAPLRTPTAAHPLRLLVTGDSLTEYLGPQLVDESTQLGPVKGWSDTHYGTGMVRADFVDWSVVARQQVATYRPDAVVVFIGGNDDQNMSLPGGKIIQVASPGWTREYARRVAICMRIWTQGGKARVYWLSMPPARSDSWSAANRQINLALKRAASQVPRARFLNVLAPVTNHGRYADYVTVGGQPTLVRTPDGIHFNSEGSDIVSHEVLRILKRDWHLGPKPYPAAHSTVTKVT